MALVPLSVNLTPGGQLDFMRFDVTAGRFFPARYRLVAAGGSGRLVRQRQLPDGTWQALGGDLPNIRRLNLTWDNGLAGGPGTGRPLILTLESGPVGAVGDNFLQISTRILPPLP
ncbi:MAG: hypothetical protein IPN90_12335 [Elusimicrobia bacterium]|nr:hypothetical protein [Elusimicrobiota bacterium]